MVGLRLSIAAAVAVAALGATARADVTWDAPSACPGRDALIARIAAELGRDVDASRVEVAGRVERAGRGWRVALTLGGGARVIEARSCRELVATAALVIAMAIDAADADDVPAEVAELAGERPLLVPTYFTEVDTETPPARGLGIVASAPVEASPPPPAGLELRVRAAFGSDSGALPGLASGVGAGVEASVGAWSLDLAVHRWFSQRAFSQPEQGAALGLTTVALDACRQLAPPGAWRVAACAGGELDALAATPFGFDDAAPVQTILGGGASAGAAVARHIAGPVWLRVDASASALLVRVGYREGDPSRPDMLGVSVHRMDWLLTRAFVSAEVRVP